MNFPYSKSRYKVLLLVTDLTFGGAETQVVQLASVLKQRGIHVCVVSMLQPKAWVNYLKDRDVEVRSLGIARGVPDPRAIARLRRIVKSFAPDVVHCHMFHANILGRVTRLVCSMPVLISTVHNLRETSERGGSTFLKERFYRLTDPLASRTTIICQAAFDRYVRVGAVPRRRLEVVPNGIDANAFARSGKARHEARLKLEVDDKFVWLAVGRLAQQKDYPNLFRAMAALPADGHVLLIAGSGPLESDLKAECVSLGINERVRFLGAREDIRHLYNAADAYVMSSEFEGFSMALLEASCMEIPIVATDSGGNREIVLDGVSGRIVPAQDSSSLASAMSQMMKASPDDRRSKGKAGRAFCVRNFQMGRVVNRWLELYRECSTSEERNTGWRQSWAQTHDQESPR